MGKVMDYIDDELAAWIEQQHVFFVATAPISANGHVNCSPKGGDSFRILGPLDVAYQDYTGSGAETVAHLRENGRIVLMFCAFDGKPSIVRLHGHGEVITPNDARYELLAERFPGNAGTRAIVRINVTRVSTSCGWAIPKYEFESDRDSLEKWAISKGDRGLADHRASKNAVGIDGLPAFDS